VELEPVILPRHTQILEHTPPKFNMFWLKIDKTLKISTYTSQFWLYWTKNLSKSPVEPLHYWYDVPLCFTLRTVRQYALYLRKI